MIVAVDAGYGYVKGVGEGGTAVAFPSIAVGERGTGELARALGGPAGPGHRLQVLQGDGPAQTWLVGEAALAAGGERSWEAQASERADYPPLVLTALGLLHADRVRLALGLPLGLYLQPRERTSLRARLGGLEAWVSVDGADAAHLRVAEARIFPQAAGAYFSAALHERGLAAKPCGVVDVGFRTTDYLYLLPTSRGTAQPEERLSGSLDLGVGSAYRDVARQIAAESGVLVPAAAVERAAGTGQMTVRGRAVDLGARLADAQRAVAEGIAAHVRRAWGPDLDLVGALLISGGGGQALYPHLAELSPLARLAPDPLFANARGFQALLAAQGAAAR